MHEPHVHDHPDHRYVVEAHETRPADAGSAEFVIEPELTHFGVDQSWMGKYTLQVALRARELPARAATKQGG